MHVAAVRAVRNWRWTLANMFRLGAARGKELWNSEKRQLTSILWWREWEGLESGRGWGLSEDSVWKGRGLRLGGGTGSRH